MLPGPQQVARAEQLGRVAAADADAPQQQPVDHEHPVAAAGPFDRVRSASRHGPVPYRQDRGPGRLARLARWSAGTNSASPASTSSTLTWSAHLLVVIAGDIARMPRVPNPRLGYILTALSATCSALNGVLSRYLLDDGMSPDAAGRVPLGGVARCC